MTAVVALAVLAAILAPHAIAARRALTISRATFRSHRESVRVGVRVGRWQVVGWQVVAVVVAVAALIGGAR